MNNTYKVAIIDDDPTCIENLHQSISQFPFLEIVGSVQSPILGKDLIMQKRPDLLFIDVEMPRITGIQLINEICDQVNWSMQVIFYTAYEKYLLEALRASAFDYLLKPYQSADFNVIINRFQSQLTIEKTKSSFRDTVLNLFPSNSPFMIPTVSGFKMLRKEQVGYFEYQKEKNQWIVVLNDQSHLELKPGTLTSEILNHTSSFIQISQRHIINIEYLTSIEKNDCHLFPPFSQAKHLYISYNFLKDIQIKFETI